LAATTAIQVNDALTPPDAIDLCDDALTSRPKEREAHLQEVLEAFPQDMRSDARMIIGELIEWKEEHFPKYKRMIIDYEVTDTSKDYHLIVISTADELEEQ